TTGRERRKESGACAPLSPDYSLEADRHADVCAPAEHVVEATQRRRAARVARGIREHGLLVEQVVDAVPQLPVVADLEPAREIERVVRRRIDRERVRVR